MILSNHRRNKFIGDTMGARVVHFEIHASNPEKAVEFYSQLFGWKFQAWGLPGMYWLITTGDDTEPGINGGLVQRRGENPAENAPVSAFVCTANVDNAKDMVEKATSLGATIALPLQAVPGVGWLAYIKDADGNIMGMMQNDPSAG